MEPLPECANGVPQWPCGGLCGGCGWWGAGGRCCTGLVGKAIDCRKKLAVGLCTENDWALPPGIRLEPSGVPQPASGEARRWCAGKDCAEGRGSLSAVEGTPEGTTAGPYPEPVCPPRDGDTEAATTFTELPKRLELGCAADREALPFGQPACAGEAECSGAASLTTSVLPGGERRTPPGAAAYASGRPLGRGPTRFLVGETAGAGLLVVRATGERAAPVEVRGATGAAPNSRAPAAAPASRAAAAVPASRAAASASSQPGEWGPMTGPPGTCAPRAVGRSQAMRRSRVPGLLSAGSGSACRSAGRGACGVTSAVAWVALAPQPDTPAGVPASVASFGAGSNSGLMPVCSCCVIAA
mmetsp:Transcript_56742/g.176467  ORF Transcript_56742/g.176467 Transcript_56742/m.176467 type:complete len:356 (+) Transcript_56742:200-1267(+)